MIEAVAMVVPARDEQDHLALTIRALAEAGRRVPATVQVGVVLVLDACADATPSVARRAAAPFPSAPGPDGGRRPWVCVFDRSAGVSTVPNVGAARHDGVLHAARLVGAPSSRTWIASTDADSLVGPDWLVHQLAVADAGVVGLAGSVAVGDWSPWPDGLALAWTDGYHRPDREAPVHGANLGVRLDAYLQVGGFAGLVDGEDQDLFDRLRAAGLPTAVTTACPVTTSGRRRGRAPAGFSGYLRDLEAITGNPA